MTATVTEYATADFYTDRTLVDDPHAYFDFLRHQGPVTRLPHRNVVAVTGYEETVQVMLDTEHFSSINAVMGPIPDLPFAVHGDDITAELEANRKQIPFSDQVVTEQGPRHLNLRSVLSTLFTPSRLKELEPRLRATADGMVAEFAHDGKVDLVGQYGGPYATLVIADLLGVPEDGRQRFRKALTGAVPAEIGATPEDMMNNPLVGVGKELFVYLTKRRMLNSGVIGWVRGLFGKAKPDILTELALAKYPDGTTPSLVDITGLAAFLFGAGRAGHRAPRPPGRAPGQPEAHRRFPRGDPALRRLGEERRPHVPEVDDARRGGDQGGHHHPA